MTGTGGDGAVRLGARGLVRRFGTLTANDRVDFAARRGTVHAIVGGNGAGKSTLMRILQGVDQPDEGSVIVDGKPVAFRHPADAFARGIGMVHQEFMLVPGLSLLENLILAREPADALGRLDIPAALAAARALEHQAGVTLDWHMPVDDAPVHVRQIVEILRLLYRGADVLILDEPTAVLAPSQVRDLIGLLQRLKADGRTILFISHKLDEVMSVADDITVMRQGRVVASLAAAATSKAAIAEMMIGEIVDAPAARPASAGTAVLSVVDLVATDPRGIVKLRGVDLTVHAGEIVAVAGVAGNGQDELVAAVTGLGRRLRGSVTLAGVDIADLPPSARRARGLAYLSPDRKAEGLCIAASIADNTIAGHHRRPAFSAGGILRRGAIARHVETLLDRYSVQRAASDLPISSLSGGNQQRVAIARELDGMPKVLVSCQPTRGVDIRGIAFIHRCLLDYRDRGGAVLLVSEELDEIIALADRIVVLFEGRRTGEIRRGDGDIEAIGRMMLGERAA
ncbi:MAG: ABC transporter ATP-binding protein [Ferrovibrionaceae bacterium]